MKENYYNGEILELWFEEGILCGAYKVDNVNLEAARIATRERLTYVADRAYPNLVDYRKVRKTDKAARDYLSTENPTKGIKAMAVLIDSTIGRVIYNFFITINKPPYPMQIFNDPHQAIEWLKQYK